MSLTQAGLENAGQVRKFRDGCFNQHWFLDLADARRIIDGWRNHYNAVRPRSSLGYTPPAVFESQVA